MGSRPRYVVRSVKVAAGSFLAAAAVSALAALGAVPAEAAAAGAAPVLTQASAAAEGTLLREAGAPERQGGQGRPAGPGAAGEQAARIAGIRQEMRAAVSLGLVTSEQADRFTSGLANRIMRGL